MRQSTPSSSSGLSGDASIELRVDGDRAQVREQAEAAAEGEQRLLRADRRVRVVPLRAADGAEQHGVGAAARLDVLGADGDAVGVDPRPADDELVPGEPEAERRARRPRGPRPRPRRPRARRRRPGSSAIR